MPKLMDPQKRVLIVQAAQELFSKYGFKKTTVDEIAQNVGIAKGTIYLYFKNKEQLLIRIGMNSLLASQEGLIREVSQIEDPSRRLQRIIENKAKDMFRFYEEFPDAIKIIPYLRKEDIVQEGGQTYFDNHTHLLRDALGLGIEQGRYRIGDLDAMVEHICFMTKAFDPPHKVPKTFAEIKIQLDLYIKLLLEAIEGK
ncbi:TetR/AcrR family transcriptional regulator [Paenibacillus oenotherae]|uniref:TetR/AcrR family transcriptional regulator n=1 Tax=Paenibacillus oenotherae TaxID=1435645 RepID=A0ABS7D9M7_9BACL|nr:TetR/AcrR family transcriptional regulator [Paenibacillus oenotherae]MBW7476581.1 TetR/AcrR family transcriptional regulator [Paenibacillus oenotherae]